MTSQVRNLWCRSQNKMGLSSKYVSSQHIVDLRQPQVAMKHHLRSVKNTCVAQSLYSEFRPLQWVLGSAKVAQDTVNSDTHQLSTAKGQGTRIYNRLILAMWNLAPHLSNRQFRLVIVIGQLWVHWCWGQTLSVNEAALELRLE